MRIRQIALVAADLGPSLDDLTAVLGLGEPYADPGVGVFGLRNGVVPVGQHFLEIVSPEREDTAAGRFLERRGGDGGYMVIFQTRNLDAKRREVASHGVRTVWEIAFDDIATVHLHPRDTGAAIVSIDEARPYESWRWAGPAWPEQVRTSRVTGIAGVEIQCSDPRQMCSRWAEIFSLEPGRSLASLALDDGGTIRFRRPHDDRGDGIRSVMLTASDAPAIRAAAAARGLPVDEDGAIVICGTCFLLVEKP